MRVLTTAIFSSHTMLSHTMFMQTVPTHTMFVPPSRNARRLAISLIVLTIAGTTIGVWA